MQLSNLNDIRDYVRHVAVDNKVTMVVESYQKSKNVAVVKKYGDVLGDVLFRFQFDELSKEIVNGRVLVVSIETGEVELGDVVPAAVTTTTSRPGRSCSSPLKNCDY